MDPVAAVSLLLAVCISGLLFTNAWKKMFGNLPPGPMPLPLVGNLLQVKNGGIAKYLHSLHEVYGEVFTVYIGLRPLVVICGYKALKEAFIDHGDHFLNRGRHPNLERVYSNSGLSVANDEKWKKLRQFTVMTFKDFGMGKRLTEDLFQEELQQMVTLFRKTNGKLFNPAINLDSAAANVIFTMVFGERFDFQDEKFQCMMQSLNDAFVTISTVWGQLYDIYPGVMYYLPGPHNTMFRRFKEFENFLAQQVKIHQETLDVNFPRDFIDSFLIRKEQEKKNETSEFDFKNLMGTIMDMIFGGIETVSTTVKHGLLYLVKYPEVQEKIFRELDEEIGQRRRPSYEDRIKLPYTQAVVHEIQRYCDIFPMGFRHSAGVDTSLRGYHIPKGTDVMSFLTTALRDPTQFKDPENFNPENFLDESGKFKKNNAFVPFSVGKRNCPGESLARMELFLFLTTILQNFKLTSPVDPKDINLTPQESGVENVPPAYELSLIPR